jgi:hypothetical protein
LSAAIFFPFGHPMLYASGYGVAGIVANHLEKTYVAKITSADDKQLNRLSEDEK